jgi:hypothetical protein
MAVHAVVTVLDATVVVAPFDATDIIVAPFDATVIVVTTGYAG